MLGTEPGSSGRAASAMPTEPSLQPWSSVFDCDNGFTGVSDWDKSDTFIFEVGGLLYVSEAVNQGLGRQHHNSQDSDTVVTALFLVSNSDMSCVHG